jgi:hypothetical protein
MLSEYVGLFNKTRVTIYERSLSFAMHVEQDTYVVQAKELGHGKNHARVPRKDGERSKHQVKKYRGQEKYSQLGIPLGKRLELVLTDWPHTVCGHPPR